MTSPKPAADARASLTRLLTVEQVAESLQTSMRTVRRLIASDELAVVHIGRLVRIHPEAVTAFLAERTRGDRRGTQ